MQEKESTHAASLHSGPDDSLCKQVRTSLLLSTTLPPSLPTALRSSSLAHPSSLILFLQRNNILHHHAEQLLELALVGTRRASC